MSCKHGNPRGRCKTCEMESMEDYFGKPEDNEGLKSGYAPPDSEGDADE